MNLREKRKFLERDNRNYSNFLEKIPEHLWPMAIPSLMHVYRSNKFLVQVYREARGFRVTICRARIKPESGAWDDGVSWEEIQEIKRGIGFGDFYAIEVYPRDADIVNVANLRHIWVLATPLDIGWFAKRVSIAPGNAPASADDTSRDAKQNRDAGIDSHKTSS